MKNSMSEALRRRKANALDLTIVIGNPKDDMEMHIVTGKQIGRAHV